MSESNVKTTVDANEVEFFNSDTNSFRDEDGTLNRYNAVRVPFIKEGLSSSKTDKEEDEALKGLRILDIGCGVGFLAEPLAKLGAEVTGIDVSSNRIESAKSHAAQNSSTQNIRYIVGSVEDHGEDHKEYYDAVVASEVVEHVSDPELFIEACLSVLKPGGSIFFTTPGKSIVSKLYVIYMAEYVFNAIHRGTHSYDKFISPPELQKMLAKNGCRTVTVRGVFLNIWTRRFRFTSYEGCFYALHAIKE